MKIVPKLLQVLKSTVGLISMVNLGINTTKINTLTASESIHSVETNVKTVGGVVNSQNVDLLALVL